MMCAYVFYCWWWFLPLWYQATGLADPDLTSQLGSQSLVLTLAITSDSLKRNELPRFFVVFFFVGSNHILPVSTFHETARDTGGFNMRQPSW